MANAFDSRPSWTARVEYPLRPEHGKLALTALRSWNISLGGQFGRAMAQL